MSDEGHRVEITDEMREMARERAKERAKSAPHSERASLDAIYAVESGRADQDALITDHEDDPDAWNRLAWEAPNGSLFSVGVREGETIGVCFVDLGTYQTVYDVPVEPLRAKLEYFEALRRADVLVDELGWADELRGGEGDN